MIYRGLLQITSFGLLHGPRKCLDKADGILLLLISVGCCEQPWHSSGQSNKPGWLER